MLLKLNLCLSIITLTYSVEDKIASKPYIAIPVPLEFPTRNEKAPQCYLRIEDFDIVETVSTYCHVAHAFLKEHISEYNSRKQAEDGVKVSMWSDDVLPVAVSSTPKSLYDYKQKHWALTTIRDPITGERIYVSQKADCHLIMYNREGTSNYRVNCEKLLSFVNESTSSCDSVHNNMFSLILIVTILLLIKYWQYFWIYFN